ncbi:MAG: HAD-IB family hydrolase [Sphingomonadales bacterium]|nr:HAD-IB family hydrolase [Sphingomonadales bacterium]
MSSEIDSKTLVLFDFDGTLTKGDTLFHFLFYSTPFYKLPLLVLLSLPVLVAYAFRILSNDKAKETILSIFFKGKRKDFFIGKGESFVEHRLERILRKSTVSQLVSYKEKSATICIVTASPHYWVEPWARMQKVDLISTHLDFRNDVFSGKFLGKNCNGMEKVIQIKKKYTLESFSKIVAFGNTKHDLPMLSLAQESFYRQF